MGSTFFNLLFFGLIAGLSARDDPVFLMSPGSNKDVIYTGLTDAEKKAVIKASDEFSGPLQENQKLVKGEYALEDNCQCSLDEPSCTCLLQLSFMNLNIFYAVGYKPEDRSIALILAIDGHLIVNDEIKISAQQTYKPPCMPLPPPTFWMAGCLEVKITEEQGQGFTICGTVDLEITVEAHVKRISSMDLTCFVYEKYNGEDRLALTEGDVAITNVRVVKGFEKATQEFNTLKMVRSKKTPGQDGGDDSVDEPFWDQVVPSYYKPPEERAGDSPTTPYMNYWSLLGVDEEPYLAILFKGFVAPNLKTAQGIANFRMIKDAINKATAKQSAMRQQNVIPNVFEPGLSCGGALLSPNKVLTVCACIRSFYYYNKHKKPAPGTGSKFDIQVNGSADIFLEFSSTQFTGKQYYHLDRNPATYYAQSSCFKLIDSDSEGQQAEMVVMPFTPRIPSQNPYRYVLWPPYPIHEKYKQRPASSLVAFGTYNKYSINFTDFGGGVLDTKTRAVMILLKRDEMTAYCKTETFQKPEIPENFKAKTTCFHARDDKYQLCKGLIGFPITKYDELAGLSASPIDCSGPEGSLMGAVFVDQTVTEIETFLGNDLKTRRTAAHTYLYREPAHIVHIIPDYSTSDATPRPPPDSSQAKRDVCSTSLDMFLIIYQISVLIKQTF